MPDHSRLHRIMAAASYLVKRFKPWLVRSGGRNLPLPGLILTALRWGRRLRVLAAAGLAGAAVLLLILLGHLLGPQQLKPFPPAGVEVTYAPLREQLVGHLAGLPGTYGIYFQDLESGQAFGINENTAIPPASCIKLPVVLYLYRQVADGKLHWSDRLTYDQASDYQTGAGALQYTARDGDTFSLRCLATVAITISDNVAHNLLVRRLGYDKVMAYIRGFAPHTTRPYGSGSTTARDMGACLEEVVRFVRENPKQGGRLLDDLSHTIFHVGIPGKLPPDLQVAHKEGSINGVANDMGIVFGKRPYLLVVLSQGIADEDTGFRNIAAISRIVYDYQQRLPAAPHQGLPGS